MATKDNEQFWRLYLYLNEGVSFLSKDIIVRKLDVSGNDLISQLSKHEVQLKKNDNLDLMDLDSLFPADGETNMDTWNANTYLSVILTLFQASLKTKERRMLRSVQHVLEDLRKRQDGTKIDHLMYEEYLENLEEAFLVLTFNDDSSIRIAEIKKIFLDEPLNSDSLQNKIAKMEFPISIKHKLEKFLETIYSTYTCNDTDTDNSDKKHEDIEQDTNFDKIQTKGAVVINSRKDNNAEIGSDEIDASDTNEDLETTSDEIDTGDISAEEKATLDEIVRMATKPQTDEESRKVVLQWQNLDIENCQKNQDFEKSVTEKLEKWKQEPVNIAVIGRSGVGKSRFVNAIRGCISEDDPLYAKVGTTETTFEVKSYPHPNNKLLKFWDLPGMGTKTFPRKDFIAKKEIDFYSYDIYLILSSDRFMEEEEEFAETIEKSGKTFLFVRTKADANEEEYKDFKKELSKIRKNCLENLRSTKIREQDVYLISSKFVDHKLLDFERLVVRLVHCLPELKKEVMMNSLQFHTKDFLKYKQAKLEDRLYQASIYSAMVGAVPVPGLSILSMCVDYKIISSELQKFRHELHITDTDLENLAQKTGISASELVTLYSLKSFTLYSGEKNAGLSSKSVLTMLKTIAVSETIKSTVKLLPVRGMAEGARLSFYTTRRFLSSALDIMVEDSEKMLKILLHKTGKTILQNN